MPEQENAIASMNSMVDSLRQENARLKSENSELKVKVQQLESSVRALEARVENQASVSTATKRELSQKSRLPFTDENAAVAEDSAATRSRRKAGKSRVVRKLLHSMSNMTPPVP